jgi:hypothetical protein
VSLSLANLPKGLTLDRKDLAHFFETKAHHEVHRQLLDSLVASGLVTNDSVSLVNAEGRGCVVTLAGLYNVGIRLTAAEVRLGFV